MSHFRALEKLYLSAPINEIFVPQIQVAEGTAEITIKIKESYFHAANAVHGAVYFKMLDDAAFFAANSLEHNFYVLTTAFTTYLTRPVSSGDMRSVGRVVNSNKSQFIAESVVYNSEKKEIARGNGIFVRSKILLSSTPGYRLE